MENLGVRERMSAGTLNLSRWQVRRAGGRDVSIGDGKRPLRVLSIVETFQATVSRTWALTHDVRELELTLVEPGIDFLPGQFISFEIPRAASPIPATRAYSIASSPDRRHAIDLLLNRVHGGTGSEYLFGLQPGDATSFKGPVGSFALLDGPRDLLLVATGTGIAPFRSMLWTLAHHSSPRAITLFWGLRSERDLYYQDELLQIREKLPNFSFVTTLSQPTGQWQGHSGRVTALVDTRITNVANLEVFLCGNGEMIANVRDIVRRKGLCPIRVEQYYDDRARAS